MLLLILIQMNHAITSALVTPLNKFVENAKRNVDKPHGIFEIVDHRSIGFGFPSKLI